ncbi:hypothetical protein QQF64_035476 [Cirrhinus molitorella]|uniref:Arginine vasotocin receptor n=1 Tax=Cirrhinus molitorella TaxID=172907 RepID=A0ABR3NFX6_9TELE
MTSRTVHRRRLSGDSLLSSPPSIYTCRVCSLASNYGASLRSALRYAWSRNLQSRSLRRRGAERPNFPLALSN